MTDKALEAFRRIVDAGGGNYPAEYDDADFELVSAALEKHPEYPSPLPNVSRVEVIDGDGRSYSEWDVQVSLSFQDCGRTLKIFVTEPPHE